MAIEDLTLGGDEEDTLEHLATLTTSTAAALPPLLHDLRYLQIQAPYLQSGGMSFLMADIQADGIESVKPRLTAAQKALRATIEDIKVEALREKAAVEATRLRAAKRIKLLGDDLPDADMVRILREAETNGQAPVAVLDLSTIEGVWALENPFTELSRSLLREDVSFLDQAPVDVESATPLTPLWDTTMSASVIPIIDFSNFADQEEKIGEELYTACRDVGFVYLKGAFDDERVKEMFEWSRKFFELPDEVKNKAPHPPEGWKHRGYSGVGLEKISKVDAVNKGEAQPLDSLPDFKESFDFGTEGDPTLENVWLLGFRSVAVDFYNSMREVQLMVLRALAIGFPGLDPQFFEECHKNGDNQLRLLRYPNSAGGLEIEDPNKPGVFIEATPIPGTIVFNLGDFLRHISNERYSMAYRMNALYAK
ncbi:hypothetical protein RQP46_005445 [Phenoliferia psychrophenolica]